MKLSELSLKQAIIYLKKHQQRVNLYNLLSIIEDFNLKIDRHDALLFTKREEDALFNKILLNVGGDISLEKTLDYLISSGSLYADLLKEYSITKPVTTNMQMNTLNKYGVNLREIKNHECFYRENEKKLIHICLNKDYKNNILLVGSPGVGKTHLISDMAKSLELDIYYIDISQVIAGTKYRGDFEESLHKILKEASQSDIVLFFDEAHSLLSTGNSDGGISATDILKPYLEKKDIKVIAATTLYEFEDIKSDSAFERRFNIIKINPLTLDETKKIIQNLYGPNLVDWTWELYDEVFNYLDSCLENRNYPDKALDFFDFYISGKKLHIFKDSGIGEVFNSFSALNSSVS